MSVLERCVSLIQMTNGPDKFMKASAGATKVAYHYTSVPAHSKLSSTISEQRQLLRLGQFVSTVRRVQLMLKEQREGGGCLGVTDALMILRLVFDACFCVLDNMTYFSRYILKRVPTAETAMNATRFMAVGFFTATIIDIIAILHLLVKQRVTGESVLGTLTNSHGKKLFLSLSRNVCDCISGADRCGNVLPFTVLPRNVGILAMTSGLISTYENWGVLTAKAAKKMKHSE